MAVSERERVAHVLRRLSMGVHPDLASSIPSAGEAITRALDLSGPPAVVPVLPKSASGDRPKPRAEILRMGDAFAWWFGRMASPDRMIAERLVWFWTDHFAISMRKVRSADLVWQYHATIRQHATGSFSDLLRAVAKSGAMLVYLDGIKNSARESNENFAREVMELHTLGRDQYTQDDVVAAARSFTGWIAKLPYLPATEKAAPSSTPDFGSYLLARRHDAEHKTLLGAGGTFDLDGALDVILAQPATARFVAAKLYVALVGLQPDAATVETLATAFRSGWSIMALVHAIVDTPAFRSDAAVRTIVRSPVEKLVGLAEATTTANIKVPSRVDRAPYARLRPVLRPEPRGLPHGRRALRSPTAAAHVRPRGRRRSRRERARVRRARPLRRVRRVVDDARRDRPRDRPAAADAARARLAGVLHPMSPRRISRREFLAGLGATGVVAAAGGYGISMWSGHGAQQFPASHPAGGGASAAGGGSGSGRVLVLLELAGGNDALNMVVPNDPAYHSLRPTLGVTDPIALDGEIGLSPKLVTLGQEYRAGRLAIVEGIGVPNPNLSHFASLQRWWTADPDLRASTGWMGRYLDRAVGTDDPIAGVAIGPGPSPVLSGAVSFATAISDAAGLQPARLDPDVRDALLQSWSQLVPAKPSAGLLGQMQRAIGESLDARTRISHDLGAPPDPGAALDPGVEADNPLADALDLAARLAASKDHPRVIHVHVDGDFDTHADEAARHPALMADLDAALQRFLQTLEHLQASDRVVLATSSEFGRRAAENGSGTDHGAAAAHFVLGVPVRGGRHGEPPSLTKLDPDGNLVMTVDYRDYDATLLQWLDPAADTEAVLGKHGVLPKLFT